MLNATADTTQPYKIFLGFVPRTLSDSTILSYFASFCSPISQPGLKFDEREVPLFTNYKILNVETKQDFDAIVKASHVLANQVLYVTPYQHEETFKEFISTFSDRCVYVSGIPLTLNTDLIFEKINEKCKLRDLFILKNGLKVNKHYGFATFETEEFKEEALGIRKFKGKKFKVTIKEFDTSQLDKMKLGKKKKNLKLKKIKLKLRKSHSKHTDQSTEPKRPNLTQNSIPVIVRPEPAPVQFDASVMANPSPMRKVELFWNQFSKVSKICSLRREVRENHYDYGNIRINSPGKIWIR